MSNHAEPHRQALESTDAPILRATLGPVIADPARFGRLFYQRLFDRAPAVRSLFPVDTGSQERKLAEVLVVLAGQREDLDDIAPVLRGFGERHRHHGAQPAHYLVVGKVLIEALAEVNGKAFDARARQAWANVYHRTVQAMEPAAGVAA